MADEEKHVWVNVWQTCEQCNYDNHICPACGEHLDHENFDASGHKHAEYCRPDVYAHEVGEDCTSQSWCLWDHDRGALCIHGFVWINPLSEK